MKKAIKAVCSVISTIAVIAVVALAVLLAGVRIIGLTPYTVLSGSMEHSADNTESYPSFTKGLLTGSLVYVKSCDVSDIEVGDVISFMLSEETVATHRVIAVNDDHTEFSTKGDNNDSPDGSPVDYRNIIGRAVFTIPYLGYLSNLLQTRQGLTMAITVVIIMLIIAFLPDFLTPKSERKASKSTPKNKTEREITNK